jgi:hypothetical protein
LKLSDNDKDARLIELLEGAINYDNSEYFLKILDNELNQIMSLKHQ